MVTPLSWLHESYKKKKLIEKKIYFFINFFLNIYIIELFLVPNITKHKSFPRWIFGKDCTVSFYLLL